MQYRFFREEDSELSHCGRHNVTELEAINVLQHPGERLRKKDGTIVAQGQTRAGRYLQVVYREFLEKDYIFVITAYDLTGKAKHAYRRRRKHS